MNKQGATKEEIIKLISHGDNTLSSICKKLDLAPSTVSKHLHDLEANDIIRQKDTHFKKWKYYDLNPNVNKKKVREGNITLTKVMVIAVSIIAIASLMFVLDSNTSSTRSYIPVSLTDPPQVPVGTQALYINYSSVSVNVGYKNSTGWINLNSSGRLNLMDLINKSQIIGLANIKPGSKIYSIKINITNASMIINNSTYNVYVPTKQIATNLTDTNAINTSSGILVDLASTIAAIGTPNTTVFVLVPTLEASIYPNSAATTQSNTGISINLVSLLHNYRSKMFLMQNANVIVTNSSISFDGDNVIFNATIKNEGNVTVNLISAVVGNSTYITPQFNHEIITSSSSSSHKAVLIHAPNISGGSGNNLYISVVNRSSSGTLPTPPIINTNSTNASLQQFYHEYNSTLIINSDALYTVLSSTGINPINITLKSPIKHISISGPTKPDFSGPASQYTSEISTNYASFIIYNNGTVSLPEWSPVPFKSSNIKSPPSIGYQLAPDSSVTLSYNGTYGYTNSSSLITNGTSHLIIFTNYGPVEGNIEGK